MRYLNVSDLEKKKDDAPRLLSAQPPLLLWSGFKWKANLLWQQLFHAWHSGAWIESVHWGRGTCYREEQCLGAEPRHVSRVACFELRLQKARWVCFLCLLHLKPQAENGGHRICCVLAVTNDNACSARFSSVMHKSSWPVTTFIAKE